MATTTALILYRGQGTGHMLGKRLLPRIGLFSPLPQPVVILNYSPWPQGGIERGIHSSLGTRRRGRLAKALHEAADREEPPEKKPKRKPRKKAAEIQKPEPLTPPAALERLLEEPPIDREPPPPTPIEEPYVPRLTRSISGIGHLRGRRRRAIQGALDPSAGGEGRATRMRRRPRVGRLEPEGIQNPTPEQILLATAA